MSYKGPTSDKKLACLNHPFYGEVQIISLSQKQFAEENNTKYSFFSSGKMRVK